MAQSFGKIENLSGEEIKHLGKKRVRFIQFETDDTLYFIFK